MHWHHRYSSRGFLAALSLAALVAASPVVAQTPARIDAVSPGVTLGPSHPTTAVPVTLSRDGTTALLGFSVTLQLSSEFAPLTLTGGDPDVVLGSFLTTGGRATNLQLRDNGGGSYTVDGVTLGTDCGPTAQTGTLFTVRVRSTNPGGTGTVTLQSVRLRDCSNLPVAVDAGSAASVTIDNTAPSIAVTSPNGGETWVSGSTQDITWTASDGSGIAGVDLEYSTNGGSSWTSIATGQPNSPYAWTVPNTPSTNVLVRATAHDNNGNTATDASDASFTILSATTTTLAASPASPSVFGQEVTLTATVSPGAASGTVTFKDGLATLGSAPVASGQAVLHTTTLAVGSHSFTAEYGGDATYAASTSSAVPYAVNQASTSTTVGSSANPSLVGQSVTFTATVGAVAPGAGTPGGSVQFKIDGADAGSPVALSGGSAIYATSALTAGSHTVAAVY
ncbi:MAG: Ig-like domain repeat protein, partial [Candidatus Eisenbacteria bacterium]